MTYFGSIALFSLICCCSHINSSPQHNAVRGRMTGSNNSGVEEIPQVKQRQKRKTSIRTPPLNKAENLNHQDSIAVVGDLTPFPYQRTPHTYPWLA